MKKSLLTIAFFAMGIIASNAQEKPVSTDQNWTPPVTFDKETHDYGTIKNGADGTCEFKFTNNGKEPILITNARGSCGCTVPE
jgi:hypothetical protein